MKIYNELGITEKSNLRRWTRQAVECYERGCICENCPIPQITSIANCKMKACVLELVKMYGKPESGEE